MIRQELEIKAYDTLRRRCNELADRLGAVSSERECPEGVKEAVCTIIWAAGKAEVRVEGHPSAHRRVPSKLLLSGRKDSVFVLFGSGPNHGSPISVSDL